MHFLWLYAFICGPAALLLSLTLHYAWHHGVHPRPQFAVAQWWHAHLALGLLFAIGAGLLFGALAATGYQLLYGPGGLLEPPQPAQHAFGAPGSGQRARGLRARSGRVGQPRTYSARPLPAAVDLSQWAPPVGDQGPLNSCASWAVGYGLASYYAARSGHPIPRGGAPMFVYSLATSGSNQGTTFPQAYGVVARLGVDSQRHYFQGNYNYWHLPTAAEKRAAQRWRSGGVRTLFLGDRQGSYARVAIEATVAGGDPVTLGIPVFDNVMHAGPATYYIRHAGGQYWGGHALVIFKYDRNGVWAEGSWGTSWGLNGWIALSWPFIERYALEADVMQRRTHP